ncbi:MAG: MspA family porin [Gordonia sp. (in: high G+C Gram-positive bacteria)]|uniref:MspA family porin n=1 Tax=Gordonia sp. (in: high G+C Gram-positive bacteria) TaxID=84139 RepID=UPI0039E6CC98
MASLTGSGRRWALAAAPVALAVALGSALAPAAQADRFVRLPNGKVNGDGIKIIKTGEYARVSPSLAANGASRTAWLSGEAKIVAKDIDTRKGPRGNGSQGENAQPGSNGMAAPGALWGGPSAFTFVGYVVGCQVALSSMTIGISGGLNETGPSGTFTNNIPLAPGDVSYVVMDRKRMEKPGTYYIEWRQKRLEINGCAGYAQARSFVAVEAAGNNHRKVSLYGRPFSIG